MGGLVGCGLGLWAVLRLWGDDRLLLASIAGLATLTALWSFIVLQRYAARNARSRASGQVGLLALARGDIEKTPDWPATVNMAATLAILVLLALSFFGGR